MSRLAIWLTSHCPNLSLDQYHITSPETSEYNCIAWGAEENDRWWDPTDPNGYWPDEIPRELTLAVFIQLYQSLGYNCCDTSSLELGFQKIAIYAKNNDQFNDRQPTHIARQLPNGRWTSKIGELEDIEHDLEGLIGFYYGQVAVILKRSI